MGTFEFEQLRAAWRRRTAASLTLPLALVRTRPLGGIHEDEVCAKADLVLESVLKAVTRA